jgi:hypothetical protein
MSAEYDISLISVNTEINEGQQVTRLPRIDEDVDYRHSIAPTAKPALFPALLPSPLMEA